MEHVTVSDLQSGSKVYWFDKLMNLPVPVAPADNTPTLTDALRSAAEYAQAEKADATRRAYLSDFHDFHTWCERVQASALWVTRERPTSGTILRSQ